MNKHQQVYGYPRLRQQLMRGEVSVLAAAKYILLGMYGFPDLLLRWPITVLRLLRALFGHCKGSVYALTPLDLCLRVYYSKVARDFQRAGRFGYVWDEAMGLPMEALFVSNYATYAVYGALSPRSFSAITLSLYLLLLVSTGFAFGTLTLSVAVTILLIVSPVVLFLLVSYEIKPELIWWSLAVPALVVAFHNVWEPVWIICGFLLLVNLSVAFLLGTLLIGPLTWFLLVGHFTIEYSVLWLAPGVLVRLLRLLLAYRGGYLRIVTNEQKRVVSGRRIKISALGAKKRLVFYLIALFIASWCRWDVALILSLVLVPLYFANGQLVKIMDPSTVKLIFLSSIVSAALLSGQWPSLLGVVMFAYTRPADYVLSGWMLGERGTEELKRNERRMALAERIDYYKGLLKDYPWLSPMRLPKPDALLEMLNRIPNGSRILLEGAGDPRTESKYRHFRNWTNEFLPARQIEFNHEHWLTVLEPMLTERYLNRLTVADLRPSVIHEVCTRLGVTFVITFTEETTVALQELGYSCIMGVRYKDYAELANHLRMPPHRDLVLLANPEPTGIVSPGVKWVRIKNSISWEANAAQAYILRYRFHAQFVATQNGTCLPIDPHPVFADLPLRFMRIGAKHDGLLTVRFVPRWI